MNHTAYTQSSRVFVMYSREWVNEAFFIMCEYMLTYEPDYIHTV